MRTKEIKSAGSRWRRQLACCAALSLILAIPALAQPGSRPIELPVEPDVLKPGNPTLPGPLPPPPPQCPLQTILAGNVDDFAGPEPTAPSATLLATVSGPYTGFDGTQPNQHFIHTFRLPPCKCLVGAKLEFRVKQLNEIVSNDSIILGFSSITGFPRWSAYLFGPPLNVVSGTTYTLDLAALPIQGTTASLLSSVQMNKYLDVYIQDDTSVDYLKLTATMCDCCQPTGRTEIGITKFHDLNRNGVKDANEPVLPGWVFTARDVAGGNVVTSAPTGTAGTTWMVVQAPATYVISEVPQPGWTQSAPTNPANPTVTVTPGGPVVQLTFGNWKKVIPTKEEENNPH